MKPTTQAAILCGGRGERLKPLTDYFQKVMLPIGPKKLPLLAYIVALMRHHGINRIALLTGYRSEDIRRYFGDGSQHGVTISYSEDPKGLKGSLNALAHAMGNGAIAGADELLVYYGDILADLEVSELLSTHRRLKADATLVLGRGYSLPVGVADVKRGLVTSFTEKPSLDLSVTTGMMVLGPAAMALVKKVASPRSNDLMTDFVPHLLRGGGKVAAFYTERKWFDVGSISTFQKLNEELTAHPLGYEI